MILLLPQDTLKKDFLKIIFLHGEIYEFPSIFFCLKIQ
jgi:hypothetical protein